MRMIKANSKVFAFLAMIALLVYLPACESDPDEPDPSGSDPIASFQYEVSTQSWNEVSFTNFSQNETSWAWDFGDNTGTSTEENPTYTYAEGGTYTVMLTVTNDAGVTASKSESITVQDPLAAQRTLIGDNGKTWYLLADPAGGATYEVGPVDRSAWWWGLGVNEDLCVRTCIFDDSWTFNTDGTFTFENNGTAWAEGAFKEDLLGSCFDATVSDNWVGANGEDLNAWNSGSHGFTYDATANTLAVDGGFIGIPKATPDGEVSAPVAGGMTYNVVKLVDADVDTLIVEVEFMSGDTPAYWRSVLVSYDNESEMVVVSDCAPVENVNVTLNVNMNDYTGTFTTAMVSGSWNGWGGSVSMDDSDADGIWSTTIEMPANTADIEYKFHLDEWTVQESLTDGSECTKTTVDGENVYVNRIVTTEESDVTVPAVCWESCDDCAVNVTAADLNGTTWSVFNGPAAVWVGPAINDGSWWTSDQAWADSRPCLFDDTFAFGTDGSTFTVNVGDEVNTEGHMNGIDADGCVEVANLPANLAAWGGGTFTFSFTEATDTDKAKITVTGNGAYLGYFKGANGTEPNEPFDGSITYEVISYGGDNIVIGVDISADQNGSAYWNYKLVKQ
jgi:PKD repeat protein